MDSKKDPNLTDVAMTSTINRPVSVVMTILMWLAIGGSVVGVVLSQMGEFGVKVPAGIASVAALIVLYGRRAAEVLKTPHPLENKAAILVTVLALLGTAIPTPDPDAAPVPTPAADVIQDTGRDTDVSEAPLSRVPDVPPVFALGFLGFPVAGGFRRRRGFLVFALGIALLAASCARLPETVKKDQEQATALWSAYVNADTKIPPEKRVDRLRMAQQENYIGTSGYATKSYKDVARTIGCQLDRYLEADATVDPALRASLQKMTKGIRVALGWPSACPTAGGVP